MRFPGIRTLCCLLFRKSLSQTAIIRTGEPEGRLGTGREDPGPDEAQAGHLLAGIPLVRREARRVGTWHADR